MIKRIFATIVVGLLCVNSLWAEQKPNIVLVLIDDMGWKDVSYMGSGYYETPNIDKLAMGGMRFTNAYSNAANCAPTRASLLSGQYTSRHGVYTVGESDRGTTETRRLVPVKNNMELALDKITLAEALKPAGYVSAAIGKWHVGNTPEEQGFDFEIDRNEIGYKGHFNKETGDYLTDRLTDEAVGFIKQNKDKPFFVYMAHHAVHTPIQAKEDIISIYKDKPTEGCHDNATYAAMIQSVDESVGKIHQTIKELGLEENTLIIFTSDNGGYGPATCMKPLRGGKGMYYEGGIREPMFVYWPGKIKPGSSCDVPVITTDFYPTFVELAGINLPENYPLDGKSLLPLIKGEKEVLNRESLYWHFPCYLQAYGALKDESRDPEYRTRPVSVIRKGDWKLLMFHEEWVLDGGIERIATNNSVELYNLKNDIGETNNVVNSEKEITKELLKDLMDWQQQINAPIPEMANPEYR